MSGAVFPPCSLVSDQTMVGVMAVMCDFLQKDLCQECCIQCPWPHNRPLLTHVSARDFRTLTGKSGSISYWGHCFFLLGPGAQFCLPSKSLQCSLGSPNSLTFMTRSLVFTILLFSSIKCILILYYILHTNMHCVDITNTILVVLKLSSPF